MKRLAKYSLVGLSGVFINEGLLWLLTDVAGLFFLVSGVIAIECSILSNFILNEFWTFAGSGSGILKRGIKFNTVSLLSLAVNASTLYALVTLFNIYYLISNIAGIVLAFAVNYSLNIRWTWRRT